VAFSVLRKLVKRRPADLFLGAEALFFLGLFRVSLALVPVRTILRAITRGRSGDVSELSARGGELPSTLQCILRVRWAVEAVARNSPIAFVCFPQTLAGYTMLRLRGIQTTMVYGVAQSLDRGLIAHTWLSVGDQVILGGEGADGFNAIECWS
jgi:hypothetical protein